MNDSNSSQEKAQEAYDYAFTLNRSAPQWYRFRWNTLHALLTNGVARVALVIPIAGYVILYSDYFRGLFSYTRALSVGILNIEQRATFTYLGGLILLLAYALYLIRCPWLIRSKGSVQQFVGEILSTNDYATVQTILDESESYFKEISLDSLTGGPHQLLHGIRHQTTYFQTNPPNLGGEVQSAIPRMLRFYFNRQNEARAASRYLLAALTIIGYLLLSVPALDLSLEVAKAIFRAPSILTF